MKIAMPCAAYHGGNPADYLSRSFIKLGHQVDILNYWETETSFRQKQHDFYICVDSGAALNLPGLYMIDATLLKRMAYWFIDYRHNKHRPSHERNPNDETAAHMIAGSGGWVFQAQSPDWQDCLARGITRCSWLPLAADPNVYTDHSQTVPMCDVAFIGNVWDPVRANVLQQIYQSGMWFGYNTTGQIWKEEAAKMIGRARIGFDISSFFGQAFAYDVNMRVFETLSCGVPLLTNWVPDLDRLFVNVPFLRTYRSESEVIPMLQRLLKDDAFLQSRVAAREWVVRNATYDLRAEQMVVALKNAGIWPEK